MEKEGNDSISRARQINSLYRKAAKAGKDKQKKIIVGFRKNASAPNKTQGRKFKMVDKRLKKDTRAQKSSEKKNKKITKGEKFKKGNIKPGKGSKRYKRR